MFLIFHNSKPKESNATEMLLGCWLFQLGESLIVLCQHADGVWFHIQSPYDSATSLMCEISAKSDLP